MAEKLTLYEQRIKRQLIKHPLGLAFIGHSRIITKQTIFERKLGSQGTFSYIPAFKGRTQTVYLGHENTGFGKIIVKDQVYLVKHHKQHGWVVSLNSKHPIEGLISDTAKTWPEWLTQKRKEVGIRLWENNPVNYSWEESILKGRVKYRS